MLREQINEALKAAMKAKDARRVSTLRMVNAAIKDRDIEARGIGKMTVTDEELLALMQKMIKQRQEALETYEKAGREDLATQEREEIAIISSFMPEQMSDVEAGSVIQALMREIEAESIKDMGRAMAALKERFAGKMDFTKAAATLKGLLTGGGATKAE